MTVFQNPWSGKTKLEAYVRPKRYWFDMDNA